jgi:Ca2+/Na+ antiporter
MLDFNYIKNGLNGIFLMMVAISGEYIGKMFPCGLQKLFERNIYCKYILAFFILFVATILSNENLIKNKNILLLFGISVLLYIWLICMTKMHIYFFITLVIILFILYTYVQYYEHNKSDNPDKPDKPDKKTYDIITLILFILSIVITIVGFLLYYGEKKYEYKKMFSWKTFIFDTVVCNKTPPKGTFKDYFFAIFNKNNI